MSLIEMIVYIGLLTIILFGSIFSAYSMMVTQQKSQDKIENLQKQERGFIALISALLISAALMVVALSASQNISIIFDEANHKQSRIVATQAALACLDKVFIELEHDYFYFVINPGVMYPDLHCGIVSVMSTSGGASSINTPTMERTFTVTGSSAPVDQGGIVVTLTGQMKIVSQRISLQSVKVIF